MEVPNSNFVSNQPELWQLSDEGHFENANEIEKCVNTLSCIIKNNQWIEDHHIQTEIIVLLLDFTKSDDEQLLKLTELALKIIEDRLELTDEEDEKLCQMLDSANINFYDEYTELNDIKFKIITPNGRFIFNEVPKQRLMESGDVFRKMLSGQFKEKDQIEIHDDEPMDCLSDFLTFLKKGKVHLPHYTIESMLALADKYDVKSLTNACLNSLESMLDELTAETLPLLLNLTLETKNDELIWKCFNNAMKVLKDVDFNLDNEELNGLIEDLKECANLNSPPKFKDGWIIFDKIPENTLLFENIGKKFPISIECSERLVNNMFKSLLGAFPTVQNLIVKDQFFNIKKDIIELKKIKSLLSFGNESCFGLKNVKNYIDQLFPIKLNAIGLGLAAADITDNVLEECADGLKHIERLNLVACFDLKAIPLSIQPKKIFFLSCKRINNLNFSRVTDASFNDCEKLKEFSLPEARIVTFSNCISVSTLNLPKATILSIANDNYVEKVIGPNLQTIEYNNKLPVLVDEENPHWSYESPEDIALLPEWIVPTKVSWNPHTLFR